MISFFFIDTILPNLSQVLIDFNKLVVHGLFISYLIISSYPSIFESLINIYSSIHLIYFHALTSDSFKTVYQFYSAKNEFNNLTLIISLSL